MDVEFAAAETAMWRERAHVSLGRSEQLLHGVQRLRRVDLEGKTEERRQRLAESIDRWERAKASRFPSSGFANRLAKRDMTPELDGGGKVLMDEKLLLAASMHGSWTHESWPRLGEAEVEAERRRRQGGAFGEL